MNPNTLKLYERGQRIWLDNITRPMLDSGTLARYIAELSVTGLTSNPTIFEQAIGHSAAYDDAIRTLAARGIAPQDLFFELALQDLRRAADLLRPVFDTSQGADGWVSLEVSPLLSHDTTGTIRSAAQLHAQAGRPNLFIKIPGTPEGIPAIEQSIFDGIPVNVTLLFSSDQYVAAAEAHLRGLERRLAAGLELKVESVASLFISRWDVAVKDRVSPALRNRLGIAVAMRAYKLQHDLLATQRWRRLAEAGARPQRLLWASTGTKDPAAPDTLYLESLVAADTINTTPEKTLLAFADHGKVGSVLPADGGDADAVLEAFRREGVDHAALAARLQAEGVTGFTASWSTLLARIRDKMSQTPAAHDTSMPRLTP